MQECNWQGLLSGQAIRQFHILSHNVLWNSDTRVLWCGRLVRIASCMVLSCGKPFAHFCILYFSHYIVTARSHAQTALVRKAIAEFQLTGLCFAASFSDNRWGMPPLSELLGNATILGTLPEQAVAEFQHADHCFAVLQPKGEAKIEHKLHPGANSHIAAIFDCSQASFAADKQFTGSQGCESHQFGQVTNLKSGSATLAWTSKAWLLSGWGGGPLAPVLLDILLNACSYCVAVTTCSIGFNAEHTFVICTLWTRSLAGPGLKGATPASGNLAQTTDILLEYVQRRKLYTLQVATISIAWPGLAWLFLNTAWRFCSLEQACCSGWAHYDYCKRGGCFS